METGLVETAALGAQAGNLSIWRLFLNADWVVKVVMLGLLAASVLSWAIIFEKAVKLRRARTMADAFENRFWASTHLRELYEDMDKQGEDPMSALFCAGMHELYTGYGESRTKLLNVHRRVERIMDITLSRELHTLERMMPFLASVGSSAPFVGLFGTVWGIMNSFIAVAATRQTSLAVVAPGIAEALFATALGLIAAVPATIGYNKLSTDIHRLTERLENFAGEFSTIIARRLDSETTAPSSQ